MRLISLAPLVWSGSKQAAGNCLFRPDLACSLLFSGCTIKPTGATSSQDRFQQCALNCKLHSIVPKTAWAGKDRPFNSDERWFLPPVAGGLNWVLVLPLVAT